MDWKYLLLLLITGLVSSLWGSKRRKETEGEADERQQKHLLISYKIGFYILYFVVIAVFVLCRVGTIPMNNIMHIIAAGMLIAVIVMFHYNLWNDAALSTKQSKEKGFVLLLIGSILMIGIHVWLLKDIVNYYNYFGEKYPMKEYFSSGLWFVGLFAILSISATVSIALKWWFDWKQEEKDAEEDLTEE
ncbi:MAG: hypothetical protein IJ744_10170 [Lachnospiraceae bacterium]|nr:hypothetical protein [Lachnospiraceae bacterium]